MEINIALFPPYEILHYGYARIYQNVTVASYTVISPIYFTCMHILIFYSIMYFNGLINYTQLLTKCK